jgi:hypothetical protein
MENSLGICVSSLSINLLVRAAKWYICTYNVTKVFYLGSLLLKFYKLYLLKFTFLFNMLECLVFSDIFKEADIK